MHRQIPIISPFELATSNRLNLAGTHPWGCKAWVRRLDIGKLDPRADECRFVGFDSESKGFRVYWPGKGCVSIERDVYFNEKEALVEDEVQIEGGTDLLTNSNISTLPSKTSPSIDTKQSDIAPEIIEKFNDNSAKTQQQKPIRRNSLEGLPQFDNEHFG